MSFGLRGIALQCQRLLTEIQHHISKELFRNLMHDLFDRLQSPRKRVMAKRQVKLLNVLLDVEWMELSQLIRQTASAYEGLRSPMKAVVRDISHLRQLGAIKIERVAEDRYRLAVRLEWPTEITEAGFLDIVKALPKAKSFLQ